MSKYRFTLMDAQRCAGSFIAEGRSCAGCNAYAVCGIGDRDRQGLAILLDKIDPQRLNIVAVALGPLAEGETA